MWHGRLVSVILPTYNERESIRRSIEDFFDTGVVDEVVVVNNNATHGTSDEVARTRRARSTRRARAMATRSDVACAKPPASI